MGGSNGRYLGAAVAVVAMVIALGAQGQEGQAERLKSRALMLRSQGSTGTGMG